jgi:hypothetical protein
LKQRIANPKFYVRRKHRFGPQNKLQISNWIGHICTICMIQFLLTQLFLNKLQWDNKRALVRCCYRKSWWQSLSRAKFPRENQRRYRW